MSVYTPSEQRRKIGHITPSSNTVLEPLTALMSRDYDALVSHHFTRIQVTEIGLAPRQTGQFSDPAMLAAAGLLAEAAVDGIVWNGTSGGWNGVDADRRLCALISEQTGVPSSTTTLAQFELLHELGLSRCGLAVPYTGDVVARICDVFGAEGIAVAGCANASVSDNRAFAFLSEDRVRALARAADAPDAECILIYCTGLAGAQLAHELEQELGKPVFDSVAVTLWKALRMAGIEPSAPGWGSLLAGCTVVPARGR
jgi:maleate isomerase